METALTAMGVALLVMAILFIASVLLVQKESSKSKKLKAENAGLKDEIDKRDKDLDREWLNYEMIPYARYLEAFNRTIFGWKVVRKTQIYVDRPERPGLLDRKTLQTTIKVFIDDDVEFCKREAQELCDMLNG